MQTIQGKKYLELKQKTSRDKREVGPIVNQYDNGVTVIGQTDYTFNFAVPLTAKKSFVLIVNGRVLTEGASNDYTLVETSPNASSKISLNETPTAEVSIQYLLVGVKGVSIPNALTVQASIESIETQKAKLPTVQRLVSGSGTYTTPADVKYIKVYATGGGGGGSGSGTVAGTDGTNGGNTTFGTNLIVANGGNTHNSSFHTVAGQAQASYTCNNPAILLDYIFGGAGHHGETNGTTGIAFTGGTGGVGYYSGNSYGGTQGSPGGVGVGFGSGGSGGGGASAANFNTGAGGGAGLTVIAIIKSPTSTYSYSVGVGGSGGGAGTGGFAGGDGASGVLVVEEHYN